MEETAGTVMGTVMGLLIAALIGLGIGAAAKALMPGPDPGGWLMTIVLGIAGSWVGGFIFSALGMTSLIAAIIGAILGAMLLLVIYRLATGKRVASGVK